MKKIFIDSSVFLAFVDRADPNHSRAIAIIEKFAKQGYLLYTSAQNVTDSYVALTREINPAIGQTFLRSLLHSEIEIVFPQKSDFLTAYRILKHNRDRQISYKEAINATLMQKRGIDQVFTFGYWTNLLGTYVTK